MLAESLYFVLVALQQPNLSVVLSVHQIYFCFQCLLHFRIDLGQLFQLFNAVSWVSAQKRVNCAERHSHVYCKLLQGQRLFVKQILISTVNQLNRGVSIKTLEHTKILFHLNNNHSQ